MKLPRLAPDRWMLWCILIPSIVVWLGSAFYCIGYCDYPHTVIIAYGHLRRGPWHFDLSSWGLTSHSGFFIERLRGESDQHLHERFGLGISKTSFTWPYMRIPIVFISLAAALAWVWIRKQMAQLAEDRPPNLRRGICYGGVGVLIVLAALFTDACSLFDWQTEMLFSDGTMGVALGRGMQTGTGTWADQFKTGGPGGTPYPYWRPPILATGTPGSLLGDFSAFFVDVPSWTVSAVGVMFMFQGWRTGRSRRRKGMCVKCSYNLTGNVSGICPECGAPIAHDNVVTQTLQTVPRPWSAGAPPLPNRRGTD